MTESSGRMSAVMQELVSGAHSTRDGVFNTLDAVRRRTRSANAALVDRVRAARPDDGSGRPAAPAEAAAPERDTRFDPEDEWELPARGVGTAAAGGAEVGPRAAGEDDDDFPPTWLR